MQFCISFYNLLAGRRDRRTICRSFDHITVQKTLPCPRNFVIPIFIPRFVLVSLCFFIGRDSGFVTGVVTLQRRVLRLASRPVAAELCRPFNKQIKPTEKLDQKFVTSFARRGSTVDREKGGTAKSNRANERARGQRMRKEPAAYHRTNPANRYMGQ
mgnify:CR=1 FL=1